MAMGGRKYLASGIRLAPPIHQVAIVAEHHIDHKTYFTIQVVPQQTDIRIVNGSPVGKRAAARQPYTIYRRYDDCLQFAARLRDAFPTSTTARSRMLSGPDPIAIPKLNNAKRLYMNSKKRRAELDRFMQALFRLPPSISQSLVVLEFFGFQKIDEQHQQQQQQQQEEEQQQQQQQQHSRLIRSQSSMTQQHAVDFYSSSLRKSASHPDLSPVLPSIHPLDSPSAVESTPASTSPLWRRFCARARPQVPPPQPEPTVSSSSLTSLCSQAASMIMPWAGRAQQQPPPPAMMHHQQHPMCRRNNSNAPHASYSTPTGGKPPARRPRKKSSAPSSSACPPPLPRSTLVTSSSVISSTSTSSSCYSRDSQSTCATSIAPSPTTSPTLRMIKIKVIYDVDNIIVIQVPRSITLTDLRSRIAQKFSDPSISLPKDFVLLFNDTRSSASSSTSAASSFSDSGMATLIAKEHDLATAMGTAWVRHEKVTIRCVA